MQVLDQQTKLRLYSTMVRSRFMEENLLKLYREGQVPGTLHLGVGQEAVSAGVIGALRDDDFVLSTYRGHSHALAKGLSARKIVAEVFGRSTGCCGGMGGSMHLTDPAKGFLLTTTTIASNIPIAAGVGYAINFLGQNKVVVSFVGDGATNNGDFHEGLNLAAALQVPYLLVIENNMYALSTDIKRSTKIEHLATRAASYGMAGYTIDGMNVFDVYRKSQELINEIRTRKSPAILEAVTYRFLGHYAGDVAQSYRRKEEVEEWKKRDPIVLAKNVMMTEGTLTESEAARIENEAKAEADDAVKFALSSPYPDPKNMDWE